FVRPVSQPFPNPSLFLFLIGDPQGTWWPGRSNKAREHHNGQDVRNHLNELDGNIFARRQLKHTLHLDRNRFRETQQETRKQRLNRPPFSEDQSCECNETTTCSHVSREQRRLSNREIRSSDTGKCAGQPHD